MQHLHELIATRLTRHRALSQELQEGLQNHIYMASLLSYEALLRGNRLYFYGEGRSYILAVYAAQRITEKHGAAAAVAMRGLEEDRMLFGQHLRTGDVFIAVSLAPQSRTLSELIEEVREREAKSIGLCARANSDLMRRCDVAVAISPGDTSLIDEMHMLVTNCIADTIDFMLKEGK